MVNELYEYTVTKKSEGKYLLKRVGMVLFYILCTSVFFLICYITRLIPVFALCPLLLWMLEFFTWRYVSIEYKYTVEGGMLRLYTVYGGKTIKEQAKFHIKEAVGFIPLEDPGDRLADFGAKRTYDLRSSEKAPKDPYAFLIIGDGVKTAVLLEAPEPSKKAILYYAAEQVRNKNIIGEEQ